MESLGRLGGALPQSEAAEKELQASFRSAALALTGLFKQGKKATNKAYIAGKREALQDVLEFLQTSLDHPPVAQGGGPQGPLTVSRLIDYICARQETLKAEAEGDEDEDEAGAPSASTSAAARPAQQAAPSNRATFPSPTRPSALSAPTTRPVSAAALHQPIASTSSSAPSSPAFTRQSPSSFAHPLPLPSRAPFPFTTPSSPLASASSTPSNNTPLSSVSGPVLAPSPLTRSQARQHRTGGAGGRKARASAGGVSRERGADRTSAESVVGDPSAGAAAGDGSLSGSMKRRWANVALSEVSLNGDGEGGMGSESDEEDDRDGVTSGHEGGVDDTGSKTAEESMEMEMDGWNGTGERPAKRIARTSLR